jgi:transposase
MYNAGEPTTDGVNAGTEERKQRGAEIAALARIEQKDGAYIVPSVTNPRPTKYRVSFAGLFPTCTCPESARRFTSDLCDAQGKGYIEKVPHFNSVLNYLENPDLFPILRGMIERAATPLRAVESNFAVDSTGFTGCRFVRWFDVKYNRFTAKQDWVKAHICTGVTTNVVTAIEIHGKDAGDAIQLPALVESTAKRFTMKEVSADKGYSGRDCHEAIDRAGATPFIAFKANATGAIGGLFGKMFHYFNYRRDDFLAHYHRRSNVESTVMMIKTKFGDSLRSKTDAAQRNETLAKVLCHNICCVISAVYELGIQPEFGLAAQ